MKKLTLALPAALSALLCACVVTVGNSSCRYTEYGSGIEAVEARGVAEFSRIAVGGAANVVASTGPESSVILRWDDNLLPFVNTEVRGDTLHVKMMGGSYSSESGLEVEIVTQHLEGVSISGAADAVVSGVDADHFDANVSGAGDLQVTGRADSVEAHVSGAGELDLSGLTVRAGDVHVSGAGDVEINARETLSASVSGAGDVHYAGDPKVSMSVSGAGSVTRK